MNEVVGGIYSLPTTSSRWLNSAGDGRTGQSGAPPDSQCALSGARHVSATVRVRSWSIVRAFVVLLHRTVRCHIGQSGAL
jgi:L,D-peptidoglycan transpeptidase YkuD (ErfK/YbiS/YcfS/YnhG family)